MGPLEIKLVRHAESLANRDPAVYGHVPEYAIALTEEGHEEARACGRALGRSFLESALLYRSPYVRTRQTMDGILEGIGLSETERSNLRIYEDPRLREVDHASGDAAAKEALGKRFGWFYGRFEGGESPADCYDRTSSFLESMMRQVERKQARRVLIVTHGLTIRCFAMRFLHLTVEDFDRLANPANCAVVTLAEHACLSAPLFTSGRWGVTGLTLRRD